jgi:decaprenylphospho-beta-D-ribofuranose 2-oxidase
MNSREFMPSSVEEIQDHVRNAGQIVARGMGRSYGDASLGSNVISTDKLNKVLNFNDEQGQITCEPGVSLAAILELIVPKGWFLPVTPGTKFVSVGGAIAADIHGKNHHVDGTFGNHVQELKMVVESGEIISCSPEQNADLFKATLGGMGLTGIITSATFSLKKIETSYIDQTATVCENLDEMLSAFDRLAHQTYSVAWIDCFAKEEELGKGILYTGEHASVAQVNGNAFLEYKAKRLFSLPFSMPRFALNRLTIKMFNGVYFSRNKKNAGQSIIDADTFFYPLDKIGNWNRMYGAKGFVQYQFVIPRENGKEGLIEILTRISQGKHGSFLAVLKLFGQPNQLLSFPVHGYTLALDFPVNKAVFKLLDELDEIVLRYGGRLYLAKDARMSRSTFERSYDQRSQFSEINRAQNPGQKFSSLLSQRLGMNWKKTALILGAKSAVAMATARRLADDGFDLILAARKADEIDESIFDCQVAKVNFDALDTDSHRAFYQALPVKPDVVLISFGYLGDQDKAQADFAEAQKIVATNYLGAISILEIVASDMESREEGTIIGVSSIAGDRGRASNYVYGSSKAGFTTYLSGLRNRLAGKQVHVITVKPGFIDTPMTKDLDLPPKLTASADEVGAKILKALKGRKNVVYAKGVWRWIMLIIRNIPEFIFKKTNL